MTLLGHLPDILILRSEFDAGWIPDMDLHDATGATGPMGVVWCTGVVSSMGLGHLKHKRVITKVYRQVNIGSELSNVCCQVGNA